MITQSGQACVRRRRRFRMQLAVESYSKYFNVMHWIHYRPVSSDSRIKTLASIFVRAVMLVFLLADPDHFYSL